MLNTLLSSQFDSWVNLSSLKSSPFFSILADECEDISTKEELTIGLLMASQKSKHYSLGCCYHH